MVDFSIHSQGLSNVFNTSNPLNLEWDLISLRTEKSISSESMYTWLYYNQDGNVDDLSQDDNETESNLNWVAYKQYFFTSALMTDIPFNNANIISEKLYQDAETDSIFTNKFQLKTPLELKSGELNYAMNWYYGPTDYKLLKTYEGTQLDEVADMGWGIFGWINKYVFIYIFGFLASFISNYGLSLIHI